MYRVFNVCLTVTVHQTHYTLTPGPQHIYRRNIPFHAGNPSLSTTMKLPIKSLTTKPTKPFFTTPPILAHNLKWVYQYRPSGVRFPVVMTTSSTHSTHSSSAYVVASDVGPGVFHDSAGKLHNVEEYIEKVIYGCRFLTLLAVWGSLVGSILCFIKGCTYVFASYQEYFMNRAKVILLLVEAIDVYLLGTVMLVFGMGLYELFISNLDIAKSQAEVEIPHRSTLFGLFPLKERPRWLEIKSVNGLKTKLGHVIVMLLLIGLLDKSKKAAILSPFDLLCFSASVLLSSGCLYLLSKLND